MLTTILLTGVILYFIYRFIKFWILDSWCIYKHFSNQGIPGEYIPILGHILRRRRAVHADDPLSYNTRMAAKFGDYYYSSLGPMAHLAISDPSLIEGVLKTNARAYHRAPVGRIVLASLLGHENILLAEGEKHARHRKLVGPVFQSQNLNSMIMLMAKRTSRFLDKWITSDNEKSDPLTLNVYEQMTSLTLEIITGCVFGTDIKKDQYIQETISQSGSAAMKQVQKRILNMVGIIPIINQLPLPGKKVIDESRENIKRIIQNIINQRKKGFTESTCKGPDLLDLILAATGDDTTQKFTDEEASDEAITFVLTGHETASSLMTWTLYHLANNPDVCRQCQAEVDSVLNDDDNMTPSMVSLLKYTEAVLKESLRCHPPAPALLRKAIEDNTIVATDGKEINIKKGTDIILNLHVLHNSEKYWNEPDKFDPSRYDERHADKWLAFGAGPRSCIGQNFAMLESKVMLALLVKRFNFELVPGQKHVPDIVPTLSPKYGMWMRISPR